MGKAMGRKSVNGFKWDQLHLWMIISSVAIEHHAWVQLPAGMSSQRRCPRNRQTPGVHSFLQVFQVQPGLGVHFCAFQEKNVAAITISEEKSKQPQWHEGAAVDQSLSASLHSVSLSDMSPLSPQVALQTRGFIISCSLIKTDDRALHRTLWSLT